MSVNHSQNTVEINYKEDLGTMKITLLYQVFFSWLCHESQPSVATTVIRSHAININYTCYKFITILNLI